jgi:hypothetical protein
VRQSSRVDAEKLADIERAINAEGAVKPPRDRLRNVIVLPFIGVVVVAWFVFGASSWAFTAFFVLCGLGVFTSLLSESRYRFLPEGVVTTHVGLGRPSWAHPIRPVPSTLLAYGDVETISRDTSAVVVNCGDKSMRLVAGSEEEPDHALLDDLYVYIEAKIAESRALADDRATVDVYLKESAAGGADYRHPAPPTSALEAIARARGMPMKLRVEAARALGTEESALEVSEELKLNVRT